VKLTMSAPAAYSSGTNQALKSAPRDLRNIYVVV